MSVVKIYTTDFCPYCVRAKSLLKSKKISFEEIKIITDEAREDMIKKSGGKKSVPQIFINDINIGGFDDLYSLNHQGKLDDLLKSKN